MPGPPDVAEKEAQQGKMNSYGKNADGEIPSSMEKSLEQRMAISLDEKRHQRAERHPPKVTAKRQLLLKPQWIRRKGGLDS